MPFANYIYEYYSKIKSGEITVGKWILAIYEIIVKGLEKGDYFFNAKKANKAIKFIESFCHHCEGREDLLTLELWQKAIVSVMFGIVDSDALRIFREVFIVIGRKNGKSLFASAVIAYMSYLDGEYGAKIYCLAPKLDQANRSAAGLEMVAELPDTEDARAVHTAVKRGDLSGMSFSFKVPKGGDHWNRETRTREILKIEKVYEISVVPFSAYPQTSVEARSMVQEINDGMKAAAIIKCNQILLKI